MLSTIAIGYRLDKATAMKETSKAMALEPGNVAVLIEHARIHVLCNDVETALQTARTAQELDPVSTAAAELLGHALYFSRHYDEGIEAFRHALSLDPHYPRPQYGIGMCQYQLGNLEAAAKSVAQEPLEWMRLSGLAIVEHQLGNNESAERAMAALIESYRDNGLYQQAQVLGQWGRVDESIDALLKAREIGDPGVSQIVVDPLIDPLREDPRFLKLLADIQY